MNTKRIFNVAVAIFIALSLMGFSAPKVAASQPPSAVLSDSGHCKTFSLTLLNDVDSSTTGWWAMDTIHRDVIVCPAKSAGLYLYMTFDDGKFVSFAGNSPNGTGTIGDGIKGTIDGGVIMTVAGTLKSGLKHDLEKIDLACDQTGACANSFSTLDTLFEAGYTSTYVDWGWTYKTSCGKPNQTWVNSQSENSGDITLLTQNPKCKK